MGNVFYEKCASEHYWPDVMEAFGKCPYVGCPNHLATSFNHRNLDDMPRTCLIEALDMADGGSNGCAMTWKEIGDIYGTSAQYVERVARKAIKKIQRRLKNVPFCEILEL